MEYAAAGDPARATARGDAGRDGSDLLPGEPGYEQARRHDGIAARRRPGSLRPLHHHRADHGRPRRAADHLAGDAVLLARRPVHRRHDRPRLSEEGQRRSSQPTGRAAVLDPTGSGLTTPPMVLVQGTADVDDRDLEANRTRYERESCEKLPATARLQPPDPLRRLHGLVLHADLHPRPARARVRLAATATSRPSRPCTTRTWRRSARATPRSPTASTPRPAVASAPGTLGSPSSARRTGPRCCRSCRPDGFPFAVRVPMRIDAAARWIRIEAEPAGIPFAPGLACLTAHEHGPTSPGSRTSRSAATSSGRQRLGAGPAQARRRVRAPPLPSRGDARQRRQGATLPPHGEARAGTPWRLAPTTSLTVAVTGPTGDIGRSLLRALERSRDVDRPSAMARRPFDPPAAGLEDRVPPGRRARPRGVERLVAGRRRGRAPGVHDHGRPRREPRDQPRRLAQRVRGGGRRRGASGWSTPRRSPPTASTPTTPRR